MSETTSGRCVTYPATPPMIPQCGNEQDIPIDQIVVPLTPKRTLDPVQVATLAGSIAIIGLQQPIIVSESMVLIAGNHRLHAVRKLGQKTIRAKIVPDEPLLNELRIIDDNLMRKDLSVLEKCIQFQRREEILVKMGVRASSGENQFTTTSGNKYAIGGTTGGAKYRPPMSTMKQTTKDLAIASGLAKSTYQELMKISRGINTEVKEKIRNTDIADNKTELLRLIKVKDPVDQMKIAEKVVNGDAKSVRESVSLVERDRNRAQYITAAEDFGKLPDGITLVEGDFFEFEERIPDNSVDMLLTDPPYINTWKENIAPFMSVCNRILKPGGALVMVIGHVRLPEVFEGFRECKVEFGENALEFYHLCALTMRGHTAAMHHLGAVNLFKPVVLGMKNPAHKPFKMYTDLIEGSGKDKDTHEWQQSVSEILPLIDAFSRPGETILDPFMGTGTYGIAARMHARKFFGIDIDGGNVAVAKGRLAKVVVEEDSKNEKRGN